MTESSTDDGLYGIDMCPAHGHLQVAWDVSIQVSPGEVVALLGPNGAGKTSICEYMAGRIGGTGQVLVAGKNLQNHPAHRRAASGLALVPEDRGLFADLTVGDNLQLGAQLSDGSIEPAIEMFPILGKRLKQHAGTLSGGEQQMLAVARAILAKPAVLIIDEPTQGLAPKIYETLIDAMRVLRERHMAILLVEQNVGFAAAIADRYYIMSGGRIVSEGGNDDLQDNDGLFEYFISG